MMDSQYMLDIYYLLGGGMHLKTVPSVSTHREEEREGGGDEPQHATECYRDAYFCRLMQRHHLEFLHKEQTGFFSWVVDYCKSSFMIHVSTYFTIQHNFYDFGGIYEVISTKTRVITLDDIQTTSHRTPTSPPGVLNYVFHIKYQNLKITSRCNIFVL